MSEVKSPLTEQQAKEVSDKIHDTSKNVFRVAGEILGRELTTDECDPTYDLVSKVGGIFKCADCNVWKETSEQCGWRDDACTECEPD